MKIAILSDIHGNLPALQSVAEHIESWRPDRVIVAGDIVNRGPSSLACLRFVHERPDWLMVRGNHEDYVLACLELTELDLDDPASEAQWPSYWTYQQLDGRTDSLADMPHSVSLSGPDGGELRVCHASMRGRRDGICLKLSDEEIRERIAPAPPVFVVGHTHRPWVRWVRETLVVNAGSAGSPIDGDVRASYAQVEWTTDGWQACIVRVPYDMVQFERDMDETGFAEGIGPIFWLIYHEWRLARVVLPYWAGRYLPLIIKREMDVARSVDLVLNRFNLSRERPGSEWLLPVERRF